MEFRCVAAVLTDVRVWIEQDVLRASVPHSVVVHCTRDYCFQYISEREGWSTDTVEGVYTPVVRAFATSYRASAWAAGEAAADLALNILNYAVPPAPGEYAYPGYVGQCSRQAGAYHLPFMRALVTPLARRGGVLQASAISAWAAEAAPTLLERITGRGRVRVA